MTPKERLYARLAGKPVDRIPNLNIVMLFAAQHAGVPYGEFCSDYRTLVKAQEQTAVDFGLDILSTMSDPFRETYDFGAPVTFTPDNLPVCHGPVLQEAEDWRKLKHYDPLTSIRTLDRVEACRLFKAHHGEEYPILGWVEGCFAEFCDLATVSEGLMMLLDEPEEVENAFQFLLEQQLMNARAQIDAGADIIGIGDAVASLIGLGVYRELVLPYEEKLIHGIQAMGAKVKLHICGNINHILADMVNTGAEIVDIDFMVDLSRALSLAKGKCSICGNLNPAEVILAGNEATVRAAAEECLRVAAGSDTYLFSGGCEVPRYTPVENMRAMQSVLLHA